MNTNCVCLFCVCQMLGLHSMYGSQLYLRTTQWQREYTLGESQCHMNKAKPCLGFLCASKRA